MKGLKKISENIYNYKGYSIRRYNDSERKGIPFVKKSNNANDFHGYTNFYSYTLDVDFKSLKNDLQCRIVSLSGKISHLKNDIDRHIDFMNLTEEQKELRTNHSAKYKSVAIELAKI